MHVPRLRRAQAACCHGAAMSDKRLQERCSAAQCRRRGRVQLRSRRITPLPPRALARGGVRGEQSSLSRSGVGGLSAGTAASMYAAPPPTPTPKSELRSSRPHRFAGGGEKTGSTEREIALPLADETDDVLCRLHGLGGDAAGGGGARDQNPVDGAGVRGQPFHLGGDRRQFRDAQFDQRVLEIREL